MTLNIEKYGPWAVVTGASSGIGTEFAHQIAKSGINLVLVARRAERLETLAKELRREFDVQVRVVPVDLTKADSLDQISTATADVDVGLLVNNAGFANSGTLLDNELDAELALLNLNSRAPLVLSHHFGRKMKERGNGGIIFIASTVAFSGTPSWSNYAATKAYVMTLSDGIARELRTAGVDVLVASPGPTSTEFWNVANGTPLLALSPRRVAVTALSKLGRRSNVVVGLINNFITLSTRICPRWLNAIVFGMVVRSMQHSKSEADNINIEKKALNKAA